MKGENHSQHFSQLKKVACTAFAIIVLAINIQAQTCPPNIDVEWGNFNNWQSDTGRVSASNSQNIITLSPSGVIANRHEVYSNIGNTAVDQYGLFPVKCPNGSGYSIKLGNNQGGSLAERVRYKFTIPATANQYSLLYWYAVVFQNPNHAIYEQPRFISNVYDETTGSYISCASFTYVGSSGLPGFQQSTVNNQVVFKTWTPVTVNLSGYAGHTISLEFTTADCVPGGHFGYAYVDVNSECSQPVQGAGYCIGTQSITLTAPYGYQNYQWFTANFSQNLGNEQNLTLNPPPADSTLLAVIVIPYDGYGCKDTIYTRVRATPAPTVFAGNDTTSCAGTPIPIGMVTTTNWLYQWTPSTNLSNPTGSYTLANPPATTMYSLTATDATSGCTVADSVVVNVVNINSSLSVNGDTIVCGNNQINVSLSVTGAYQIQWYKNNQPISGATGNTLAIQDTGRYYATLQQSGCIVSTRVVEIKRVEKPTAAFTLNATEFCFPNNLITAAANSNVTANTYQWLWGDGATATGNSVQHNYTNPGTYTITLMVTNPYGCSDTSKKSVTIKPTPQSAFEINTYCVGVFLNIDNTTTYIGSSTLQYQWSFGNGNSSNAQNPVYQYAVAGNYQIRLAVVAADCPADTSSFSKIITIVAPPAGKQITISAIINQATTLQTVNQGNAYLWLPADNLNSNTIAQPLFTGNADKKYLVSITNDAGCTTIDTVDVKVYKAAGIWVPKAFSPNNDGVNDRLYPFLIGIKELRYFRVWNRWGQLVYESKTDLPGWNGIYNNKLQPIDAYVWEAIGITQNNETIKAKGTVNLLQ